MIQEPNHLGMLAAAHVAQSISSIYGQVADEHPVKSGMPLPDGLRSGRGWEMV